ncbi:hypothetical protein [Luedemannella helvata]|uniref:Uncharacterized protein n=1 Tax=Luedemannella helvata TaxID=349315 RepID=A0ABN2KD14_9ACTN
MIRIGITGHIHLTAESSALIYDAIVAELREYADGWVRGVTCLADGADQIFARAVLATRGTYEVILPARDYRDKEIRPEALSDFDELVRCAAKVSYTAQPHSGDDAFLEASMEMLRRSDRLLAVWDGRAGGRSGGTADVVTRARAMRLPVTVIWPDGAARTRQN